MKTTFISAARVAAKSEEAAFADIPKCESTVPKSAWRLVAASIPSLAVCALPLIGTSCANRPVTRVQARYWAGSPEVLVRFPEQDPAGPVWADLQAKDNIGLCFSGGGTRAATAAVGQLRALSKLGILRRVRYISAVSGGAWTATPYTFIRETQMEDFLEAYVPPERLSASDLIPGSNSMTKANSQAFVTAKVFGHMFARRGSEAYARTVAECFLEPFQLDEPNNWFTWSEKTAAEIVSRNSEQALLGLERCYTVPAGRPFLIVGGTVRHYDLLPWRWGSRPEKRIPLEYTPLYSGVRPWIAPSKYTTEPIGGGYVESFAFDSIQPEKKPNEVAVASLYRRGLWRTTPALTLADVMGSTGAAPGEFNLLVETIGFPKFNYWSPQGLRDGDVADVRYAQQDGGLSENLGVMPLLARRVERIVAFVNAEAKAQVGNNESKFPDYILGLFGRPDAGLYEHSQVFDSSELDKIAAKVAESLRHGGSAVAASSLKVRRNTRFGVEPYTVRIFWVFLEGEVADSTQKASRNWAQRIPESSAARRTLDWQGSRFKRFPNYRTFGENRGLRLWDVIRLYDDQAALLAHYTAWTVHHAEDKLRSFLAE